jgi:hypothetical protein
MPTSPRTYPPESAAYLAGIPTGRAAPTPKGRIARVNLSRGLSIIQGHICELFNLSRGLAEKGKLQ